MNFSPLLERIDEIDVKNRGIANLEEFENSKSSAREHLKNDLDMTYNFKDEFNPISLLQATDTLSRHRSLFRPSFNQRTQS